MSRGIKFLERGKDLIGFYRQHPCLAAHDLLQVDLPPPQRLILRDMWFKPYVMVTAGRGCGKCVVGDTLVFTSDGLEYIESMGNELSILEDIDTRVKSANGVDRASKWYYDGVQDTNTINTRRGYSISGTDNHRVLVLKEDGVLSWAYTSDIEEGDVLAIDRHIDMWPSRDSLSEDEATLLGLIVGDGCTRGTKYCLSFANQEKSNIDLFSGIIKSNFDKTPRVIKRNNHYEAFTTIKSIYNRLEELGITNNQLSIHKTVPSSILKGTKNNVSAFLRALFECDGGCEKNKVSYCTMSQELGRQVHIMLLNFGIVSTLREKTVKYNGSERVAFVIDITSEGIDIFREEIGFLSDRKKALLDGLCDKKRNPNLDVVYGLNKIFELMWDRTRGTLSCTQRDFYKKYKNGYYNPSYNSLEKSVKLYPYSDECKERLLNLIERHYYFDKVTRITHGREKVYDLVVPEEKSFVANGVVNHNTFLLSVLCSLYGLLYPGKKILIVSPSFRQSKMVFDEVEQRYIKAPILREATTKKPTTGADRCYLHFRGAENKPGAIIQAVPLGDGSKIRGLRGHLIVTDEFAQVPQEIFDMVIRPMGATTTNPMEKVRRLERLKENLEAGIITQEDYDAELSDQTVNKIVCTSSAYYTFNHMYRRIQAYEDKIAEGNKNYAVHYVSYKDMPLAFLDMNNIENAKATMSRSGFSIEYNAVWESDSDGIFKASVIDSCRNPKLQVKLKADPGRRYIMGVDPARSSDAFAIVVIEVGNPSYVVYATQAIGQKFPEMAQTIFDLCDTFSVSSIMMDAGSGGGGVAIKDLLANEQFFRGRLILDKEDDEYKHTEGRKILRMHLPRTNSVAEAVHASVNLLEQNLLNFPYPPYEFDVEKERAFSDIQVMIRQMLAITQTETRTGQVHFDIPADGSGSRKKDLYSAFVLAAKCLYDELTNRVDDNYLVNKGGLIIPKDRTASLSIGPRVTNIMNLPGRR